MSIYLIRVNYDDYRKDVVNAIVKNNVLHQGWGCSGMELKDGGAEKFATAWDKAWPKEEGDKKKQYNKFKNLSIMINIKLGDIIIVPKAPEDRSFMILEATGSYKFDSQSSTIFGCDDFRHTIPVQLKKVVKYDYSDTSRTVKRFFRSYQYAVNNVYSSAFSDAVVALLQETEDSLSTECTELSALKIREMRSFQKLTDEVLNKIHNWAPSTLEKLICELFVKNGLERIGSNIYDSQGGDIDISFNIPSNPLLDALYAISDDSALDGSITLPQIHVQAKNKSGVDRNPQEGIMQLVKMREKLPPSIDILINTSTEMGKDVYELAAENNVILLDGGKFVNLLLTHGLAPLDGSD